MSESLVVPFQQAHTVTLDFPVASASVSPNDLWVALALANGNVLICSTLDGQTTQTLTDGHAEDTGINAVAWAPDSRHLCTAGDDWSLCWWDWFATVAKPQHQMFGHRAHVTCVDVSRCGALVVSGSFDCTIRLWSTKIGHCLRSFPGGRRPVTSVSFTADSAHLLASSWDGTIRLWNVRYGRSMLATCRTAPNCGIPWRGGVPVLRAQWAPGGRYAWIAYNDHVIHLWDVGNPTDASTVKPVASYCDGGDGTDREHAVSDKFHTEFGCVRVSQKTQFLVTGSADGRLVGWDSRTTDVVWRTDAPVHDGAVISVACAARVPIMVSACVGGKAIFWHGSAFVGNARDRVRQLHAKVLAERVASFQQPPTANLLQTLAAFREKGLAVNGVGKEVAAAAAAAATGGPPVQISAAVPEARPARPRKVPQPRTPKTKRPKSESEPEDEPMREDSVHEEYSDDDLTAIPTTRPTLPITTVAPTVQPPLPVQPPKVEQVAPLVSEVAPTSTVQAAVQITQQNPSLNAAMQQALAALNFMTPAATPPTAPAAPVAAATTSASTLDDFEDDDMDEDERPD